MTTSIWQSSTEFQTDVVVVGGGIAGISTAYWLKKMKPDLRIIILEAQTLAQGATGRNAGFLLQGTATDFQSEIEIYGLEKARRLWQFTSENRHLVLSELDPSAFDFDAVGSFIAAGSPEEQARLENSASLLEAEGVEVQYFDAAQANAKMKGQGFLGALYVPSNGQLNSMKLVRHIVQRTLQQGGVQVFEHHPLTHIEEVNNGVLLHTPSGKFRAGQAVLALNAYLPQLFPEYAALIQPKRAQMFATEPIEKVLDAPIYSHEGYYYIRQHRAGNVMLGGARHLHLEAEQGYEDVTTEALQHDLEMYLETHFPQLASLAIHHRWSGIMGFSPDHLPMVGAVPNVPSAHWVGGFTGHGMGYGFRMGRLMAERVLLDSPPEAFDLFDVNRMIRV